MAQKTYAVTGASGHIGKGIVEGLKAQGHAVRPVSRRSGVNLDDQSALAQAFTGVDAVFLMVPPEVTAPNIRARQNEVGQKLTQAVKAAKVRRVVLLSSIEGHLSQGTGPILGLHDLEERLTAESLPELVILRPTYFMENHLVGIGLIQQAGIYGSALRADVSLPMIATRDIAVQAVVALTETVPAGRSVRELLGPRNYTMQEATRILGTSIGKPDLKYVQFPYADALKAMVGMGLSESYAGALVEMSRHFNEAQTLGTQPRGPAQTTPTTLEQFARDTFQKAYSSPAATGH